MWRIPDIDGRNTGSTRDRLRRVEEQPITLPAPRDQRLTDACHLVEADLSRPCSLAELARHVHTGERTLSRLFRNELGMTYPQWRTRTRIFAAMVMLAEGATVTDTAHACGWASAGAFVDIFARTMGTTPGTYRAGVLDRQEERGTARAAFPRGRRSRRPPCRARGPAALGQDGEEG